MILDALLFVITCVQLSQLNCLQEGCVSTATQRQIKRSLGDNALYERYEALTLARGLDMMHDVARYSDILLVYRR